MIQILFRAEEIEHGRAIKSLKPFYKCHAESGDLFSSESYTALQNDLKDTAVFKVRNCERIRIVHEDKKHYLVEHNGKQYEIYQMQFIDEGKNVLIKANGYS